MKKEQNGHLSENEELKKEMETQEDIVAKNIKDGCFNQEKKAKEILSGEEKNDWKQVEWLFKKAAKLAEIRKYNLFNKIVDLMVQFYDAEHKKFVAMPLTQKQKCALTKLTRQYIEVTQTEGNVFVDSTGKITCNGYPEM